MSIFDNTQNSSSSVHSHMGMVNKLNPLIERSQHANNFNKLLKEMDKIYKKEDKKVFIESYWRILINIFCAKKSPYVTNALKFFEKLASTVGTMEYYISYKERARTGEVNPEEEGPFKRNDILSHRIIRICAKYCIDERAVIRTRILEVLCNILYGLKEASELPTEIRGQVVEALLARLRDKVPGVRIKAAHGLAFFLLENNLSEDEGEIRNEIIFSASRDPSNEVRKICTLAITPKLDDISEFLKRVRDVSESVRYAAYDVILKKTNLNSFSIVEKSTMIMSAFNDPSDRVKRKIVTIMREWLNFCNGNVLELLKHFEVMKREELCTLLLDTLYEESDSASFEKIDLSFLKDQFIPLKRITEEKCFFWRYLFDRFADVNYCFVKLAPSLNQMIDYILSYIDRTNSYLGDEEENDSGDENEKLPSEDAEKESEEIEMADVNEMEKGEIEANVKENGTKKNSNDGKDEDKDDASMKTVKVEEEEEHDEELYRRKINFNLTQMLTIIRHIPLEEGGRRELQRLVRFLFRYKRLKMFSVRSLMLIFFDCFHQDSDRNIAEILREALNSSFTYPEQAPIIKDELTEKQIYEHKSKLAELQNKRILIKSQIDVSVALKDFTKANELQIEFTRLSVEIKEIRYALGKDDSPERPSTPPSLPSTQGQSQSQKSQEDDDDIEMSQEVLYPTNSIMVVFGALSIYLRKVKSLNPIIKDFIDNHVPQAIINDNTELRQVTLQLLTTMGFISTAEAHRIVIFDIQALLGDNERTADVALRSLFDLVLHYGVEFFKDTTGLGEILGEAMEAESQDQPDDLLRNFLLSFFKSDEASIVETVVKGTMKLLLTDRIHAPNIISTLLCTWVNPINEGSGIFYAITDFISLFAGLNTQKAQTVADAFIPCIRKILKGKRRGYLDDGIHIDKLVNLILSTTNPVHLNQFTDPYKFHLSITQAIIKRIQDRSGSTENPIYCKGLKIINLYGAPKDVVISLILDISNIREEGVEIRTVQSSLLTFSKYLKSFLSEEDLLELAQNEGEVDENVVEERSRSLFDDEDEEEELIEEDESPELEEQPNGRSSSSRMKRNSSEREINGKKRRMNSTNN